MTDADPARKPPPAQAIQARRRDTDAKLAAVRTALKTLVRTGAPITRAGIAALAGVSRSFTYQNDIASTLITTAQQRVDRRS